MIKVLIFVSDVSGCFEYRVRIPFSHLTKYGVEYNFIPEIPNNPFANYNQMNELLSLISQYDLVILQRCYEFTTARFITDACNFLNIPIVFETDDDYMHIPHHNPVGFLSNKDVHMDAYKEILKMVDAVTVSTKELKEVVYPYNRNVHIFPNNIETIYCGEYGPIRRAYSQEEATPEGNVKIRNDNGFITIPAFYDKQFVNGRTQQVEKTERHRVVRIGYTGTPTHQRDFMTIWNELEKIMDKFDKKIFLIFLGDDWFTKKVENPNKRMVFIPPCQYQLYMYQIRNFDIGIAPIFPDIFNMSKSPIKAIEYATWGTPSVLPNYVTYTREFTNNKNCLMYNNSREFYDCVGTLIEDHELRNRLGTGARDHIRDNRLERNHSQRRFDFYLSLTKKKSGVDRFIPCKGMAS